MKASGVERIRWRLRYEKALVIEPIGLSGGMSSGRLASILIVVKHHRTLWMCKNGDQIK